MNTRGGTRTLAYALVGILLAAILVGFIFLLRLGRPNPFRAQKDFPRAEGPVDAPVQIIEYSDFQCPACSTARTVLRQLREKYGDRVRLVYQHFPLEGHRWAPLAHRAAECAATQKAFWPYHDRLYERQSEWSGVGEAPIEAFLKYAKDENLNLDLFAGCLSDLRVDAKIREEKAAGTSLGVNSTPSFFVNGKFIVGVTGVQEEVERLASQ